MQFTIIKTDNGYLISEAKVLDELNKDVIYANIQINKDELNKLSYKELKGELILDRYNQCEKLEFSKKLSNTQKKFRQKYNINVSLEEFLKGEI